MRAIYKDLIKTLPTDKPQCYSTANCIFDQMKDKFFEKEEMTFDDLYNIGPSLSVIEIHISIAKSENIKTKSIEAEAIRKQYDIKNRFWIPRIFNHSFNIFIRKKYVYIGQSWFRVSNYKIKYKMKHKKFIKWLDRLKYALENYSVEPETLFNLFKYFDMAPDDQDTKNLLTFIKDAEYGLETELIIKTLVE